ncbi:tRNA nucleotidyltransferase [Aeromonas phage 65.2]|uniref:tRNA nucleotidyltransferase n=2 Tax=Ishigurovirus osborne TaxID=260149 RepID=A0A219YCT8_9CAUD|nr:tRNA nucleotidyltransferase [Aeromonas phage 65.2]
MKTYLVGGAVRDKILGRECKDMDWVIVGETVENMDKKGYQRVGEHFPVYLLPNGDELAMARTERSTGDGYNDFVVDFNPTVTIQEDLYRRDFTINAIAYDDETGSYIDPYGGICDIVSKKIRMVNPNAFRDDPLRVFRAIRFACRYGFEIEIDTHNAIVSMVKDGKLKNLPRERMFLELTKIHEDGKMNEFYGFIRDNDIMEEFGFSEFTLGCDYDVSLQYFLCTLQATRKDFEDLDKIYKIPNEFKVFADVWYFDGPEPAILTKCRAEQEPNTPMLDIALDLGMVDVEQVKAYRSVTAKDFPELTGKELGDMIRQEREKQVLGLYLQRLTYHKEANRCGWKSWDQSVREVKYEN